RFLEFFLLLTSIGFLTWNEKEVTGGRHGFEGRSLRSARGKATGSNPVESIGFWNFSFFFNYIGFLTWNKREVTGGRVGLERVRLRVPFPSSTSVFGFFPSFLNISDFLLGMKRR